jgi:hypothetical protein
MRCNSSVRRSIQENLAHSVPALSSDSARRTIREKIVTKVVKYETSEACLKIRVETHASSQPGVRPGGRDVGLDALELQGHRPFVCVARSG